MSNLTKTTWKTGAASVAVLLSGAAALAQGGAATCTGAQRVEQRVIEVRGVPTNNEVVEVRGVSLNDRVRTFVTELRADGDFQSFGPRVREFVAREVTPLRDKVRRVVGQRIALTEDSECCKSACEKSVTVTGYPAGQCDTKAIELRVDGQLLPSDCTFTVDGAELSAGAQHTIDLRVVPVTGVAFGGAQIQPDGQPKEQPKRVRGKATAATSGSPAREQSITVVNDDEDSVSVRMENGKVVSVERNGKRVPLDRVRQEDGKIRIVDENGKVVHEIATGVATTEWSEKSGDKQIRPNTRPEVQGNRIRVLPQLEEVVIDQPKVMIGIQMAEADRSLVGHFGLKEGEVTMVSGVYDGLPASAAGLSPYDIIVSVDGKSPAGQEDVRKALRSKNDGDVAVFTVIKKGKRQDLELKLVPFDGEKLESSRLNAIEITGTAMGGPGTGGPAQIFFAPGGKGGGFQQFDMQVQGEKMDPMIREYIDQAMKMKGDAAMNQQQQKMLQERLRTLTETFPDGPQKAAPMPEGGRVRDLEDRLDRLEKMLERLLERRGGEGGRGGPRTGAAGPQS